MNVLDYGSRYLIIKLRAKEILFDLEIKAIVTYLIQIIFPMSYDIWRSQKDLFAIVIVMVICAFLSIVSYQQMNYFYKKIEVYPAII